MATPHVAGAIGLLKAQQNNLTYQDYKILFEARKIIYFHFPATSRKVYCHECLFKEVHSRMKPHQKFLKIFVEDLKQGYTLSVERED